MCGGRGVLIRQCDAADIATPRERYREPGGRGWGKVEWDEAGDLGVINPRPVTTAPDRTRPSPRPVFFVRRPKRAKGKVKEQMPVPERSLFAVTRFQNDYVTCATTRAGRVVVLS